MEATLLATKLFIPPPTPGLVLRGRLVQLLQRVLANRLTVVCAPAGFGKTTLVCEWIHSSQPPVPTAWLSLEEGENDPVRFWDYFIAALRTIQPTVGEMSLALLHSSRHPSDESLLTPLINDLSAVSGDLVLVLDDYHFIRSASVHQGLTFFLEHSPPKVHVVIATRTEPPLQLAHFRGRGTMLEIDTDDLRFTIEEAAALFKTVIGNELSAKELETINYRTEGWVVGLKMAALSLGRQRDMRQPLAALAGSRRYIMDYLMDEVLRQQPLPIHDFLLKTSVLERLNAPLCDAVTGRSDGAHMLREIERAHLFLVPLDESGRWYRYHHLFSELLHNQLEGSSGADEIKGLHLRASQWYDDHGYPDDAIRHSLKIRDWEKVTGLIAKAAAGLIKRGQWNTLSGWFQEVPEESLQANPVACAHYANVLVTGGRLEEAEAVLANLERTPNLQEDLRGQLTFFRMEGAYHRGDLEQTMELGERALEQLTAESGATRARALHILAVLDMGAGRLERAQLRETEALQMARRVGESWIAVTAAGNMSLILLRRGKLRHAMSAGQQAVELAAKSPAPAGAGAFGALAQVLYEQNDLERAILNTRQAIKMGELTGFAEELIYPCYYLAEILFARGDVAGAEESMVKGDEACHHPSVSPLFLSTHVADRVMFAIQAGDFAASEEWGNQLSKLPPDALLYRQHVPARFLIARGDNAAAAEQLRGLYERAIRADAWGLAIRLRVYQAIAAATQDEASAFLAEALKMGQPEGFIRTFVDEGRLLSPLLRQAVRSGIEPEYARKLLAIIQAEEQRRQAATAKGVPIPQSSECLSQRELEVLRLAAEGLSNQQIAEKLTVTLSTAKAHLHNITGKLGSRSRTQAIARARELKLI